jgi:hypothetical protein
MSEQSVRLGKRQPVCHGWLGLTPEGKRGAFPQGSVSPPGLPPKEYGRAND